MERYTSAQCNWLESLQEKRKRKEKMDIEAIARMMLALFLVSMLSMAFGVNAQSTQFQWKQVNIDGFGDPNNASAVPLAVFGGNLYAGTANFVTGGEVWRAAECMNWVQVSIDGFGDPNNVGACTQEVFNDALYVGTWNEVTGGEVWRTSDGTNWVQVNIDGFGDPNNVWVYPETVFEGNLYTGTENFATGGEVWRTSDGTNWTNVLCCDGKSSGPKNAAVFGGNLYQGTWNYNASGEVWRTSDGTNWTQLNIDGFGDPKNVAVFPCMVFRGDLYAGTINEVTGGEIWRLPTLCIGGIAVPVDKFGLLAPYVGLASTIIVAAVATTTYVKRVKRRKENQ